MANKKVNPYEKKKKRQIRITRKQWIAIISLLSVVALIVGIVVAIKLYNNAANDHTDHDHDHTDTVATADPHAGHNHGADEDCTVSTTKPATNDPHAGHNHGADEECNDTGTLSYRYYTNADKTYRVQVVDKNNKVVFEKDKLYNAPFQESVNEDIVGLCWATGSGANDFEYIFWNKETGVVSEVFWAPRGFDGTRIACPSEDQTKIVIRDIFDSEGYHKEYTLEDAYTKGEDVVVGGRLKDDGKTVLISYVVDEKNTSRHVTVSLYE